MALTHIGVFIDSMIDHRLSMKLNVGRTAKNTCCEYRLTIINGLVLTLRGRRDDWPHWRQSPRLVQDYPRAFERAPCAIPPSLCVRDMINPRLSGRVYVVEGRAAKLCR